MTIAQRAPKSLKSAVLFSVAILAVIILVEGVASLSLFSYDLVFHLNRGPVSRIHMQYDTLLGWTNIPNLYLPDMYGPEVSVRINAQGFRSNRDVPRSVPAGKRRILCSGDSFTFGIGVDNEHTWCELLAAKNSGLESVNMGTGGFGVDQSYLFYERDGTKLAHDIHIFAFVSDDFRRVRLAQFVGYPKPVLLGRDGTLVTAHVPVRRRPFFVPYLAYNSRTFNGLRMLQLAWRIAAKVFNVRGRAEAMDVAEARQVVLRMFEELDRLNRNKGSRVVFVYLPQSVTGSPDESEWRQFLQRELTRRHLLFVDLVSGFRRLPYDDFEAMFQPVWGHYSIRGNEYVADQLYQRLLAFPQIATTLSGRK